MRKSKQSEERNSSVELLKIIAIFLILISHVIWTVGRTSEYIAYDDYVVDLSVATTNIQHLIMIMLYYSGALGNTVFFVCSSWFLVDSNRVNKKKMLYMALDVWVISVIIFIATYSLGIDKMDPWVMFVQLFPNIFANNWYITCYLIFYSIHPVLNGIINNLNQRTMLRCTLVLSILYICFNFISTFFFPSPIILWVAIYFIISYMKRYLKDISENLKINKILFLVGFIGNYGLILLTNFLGLKIGFFQNKVLYWSNNCNPFLILMVIGLFNIVRNIHFESKVINNLSKLSLLIYVVHDNSILRTYYRPQMWHYVYNNYGYNNILMWTIVLGIIIFLFGVCASIFYYRTIRNAVIHIGNKIYSKVTKFYLYIENLMLKAH